MPEVNCHTSYLSQECINDCIDQLPEITAKDPVLHIYAHVFVKEVNISLLAYVLLFKRRYASLEGFKVILHLRRNVKPYRLATSTATEDPDEEGIQDNADLSEEQQWRQHIGEDFDWVKNNALARTLRQYLAHLYLQSEGDTLIIEYGHVKDEAYSTIDDIFPVTEETRSSWFTLSRRFIPIISLDPESFDRYFRSDIGTKTQLSAFVKDIYRTANSELRTEINKKVRVDLFKTISNKSFSQIKLARIAFFRALHHGLILNFYLNDDPGRTAFLRAGGMGAIDSLAYYQKVEPIFTDLNQRPPIYHFVFATLISSAFPSERFDKKNPKIFADDLADLWGFVKELVYGIQELALNIIEHADPKYGLITGRVYNSEDYIDLNPSITALFTKYLDKVKDDAQKDEGTGEGSSSKVHSFFDFQVADDGSLGVIQKLLNDSREMKETGGSQAREIDSDIRLLESGNITLGNLLDPNRGLILNQQAKRATAHFGLLTLAKLVEGNGGLLLGSSWKENAATKERQRFVNLPDTALTASSLVSLGTNYQIVLPIDHKKRYQPKYLQEEPDIPDDARSFIEGIERLFDYRVALPQDLPLKKPYDEDTPLLIIRLDHSILADPVKEYWDAFPLRSRQKIESQTGGHFVVALDMEDIVVDHGKLFRLIGNWELEFSGLPLILFNIPTEAYLRLLQLNNLYVTSQQIPFWNKGSLCTFYSYVLKPATQEKFYYTDVLWGQTLEEFAATNILVSRVAFNALSIDMHGLGSAVREWLPSQQWEAIPQLKAPQLNRLAKFGIFDKKGIILPFELLIPRADDYPLFVSNATILLQNEIRTEKDWQAAAATGIQNYFSGLQGYKISNSHFRIGSKIHISDFYYAKRFFQNSFFSSPLAYLLVIHILKLLREPSPEIKKRGTITKLTLVGYGRYAELLVSLTERFLQKAVALKLQQREISINYDLLNEMGEGKFLKNEDLYDNVVVINPIASTFSSSIKVEESVYRRNKNTFIFGPHLNLVYIYNSNPATQGKLSEYFGLSGQDLEKKSIKVTLFSSVSPRDETMANFFIPLPTLWFPVEDCDRCFPKPDERLAEEKPIYITDDTLVTPALIFGFPRGRTLAADKKGYVFDDDCIKYGHYWHNKIHYLFYINIEWFFKLNHDKVRDWLEKLGRKSFSGESPVTIISPNHYTNTSFLNTVNEVVFSNAATVIHYDPESDFIQNFQLFYHKELNAGGGKIIFVDDIITTGSAFLKTNYFLQQTRAGGKGFDAAILLMDRSDYYAHDAIISKFEDESVFHSFADIQLPSLKSIDTRCPICLEQERYEELFRNSFLDRLKYHFLEQSAKIATHNNPLLPKMITAHVKRALDPSEINAIRATRLPAKDPARYIRRLDAINRVYQWFSKPEHEGLFATFDNFDAWKKHVFDHTICPFDGSDLLRHDHPPTRPDGNYHPGNGSDALLKVLTQSPFTSFKPVREKVFTWVINYLSALVHDWETSAESDPKLTPEHFRVIKFLIRRAGQLNSNYLISAPFFDLLRALYGKHGIGDMIRKTKDQVLLAQIKYDREYKKQPDSLDTQLAHNELNDAENDDTNLRNFNVFFAAQVKELLFLNEGRSIKLEQLLKDIVIDKETSPLFIQLIRILREENGILLHKFWDYFRDKYPMGPGGKVDFDTGSLGVRLTDRNIAKHYRSQTLREFLAINGGDPKAGPDERFKNYLWLMNYLTREHSFSGISLSDKTEIIVDRLRSIVFSAKQMSCGAFFIIEYEQQVKDGYFVAYNDGEGGKMEESFWRSSEFNYIETFLNGKTDNTGQSAKTIIELYFNGAEWVDIYRTSEDEPVKIHPKLLPAHNHLLLIRLNRRTLGNCELATDIIENRDHPLGVLGFFYQMDPGPDSLDIVNTRYLLLLRDQIAAFIHNHHENNEFKDWMDADRLRKAALLTGHGREMLINVANYTFADGPPRTYKDIVSTIQMIQSFIIDIEREKKLLDYIVCTCKRYFTSDIDLAPLYFKEHINQMILDIFELNEVENRDAVAPHIECPDDLDFKFAKKLLDMFLFELIVNAKKNRWLLKKDFINQVEITVSREDDKLKIVIKNTGPTIENDEDDTHDKLNLPHNTKKRDDASGIYLIKRVLSLFKLGSLEFPKPEPVKDELSWFIAELTLNTWHVDDKCFTD